MTVNPRLRDESEGAPNAAPKPAKKPTHPWRLRGGRSPDYREHPALPDMRSRVIAR